MKRFIIYVAIFLVAFIVFYIGLSYLVPGVRIKLAADATTYFIESIRRMICLKSITSFVIGSALADILFLVAKRKSPLTRENP
ncbi:MAG: hypothetical protein HFE86_02310 [Clostridiales bacterium]|nr:hypothetical protein [Clostridiales bacterium]